MTTTPQRRPLLPLLTSTRHGSRSWATCHYRCDNACDKPEPNTSENPHVQDVITRALRRRSFLAGSAAGAGALVLAHGAPAAAAPRLRGTSVATDDWTAVPPNVRDTVSVPQGYRTGTVIAWGDPVLPGAPAFDPWAQTPETAAQQFGYNADYVGVLPLDRNDALLVVNHEYTNEEMMFPAGRYDADTVKRIALANHGMSVVAVQRLGDGSWKARDLDSRDARRYNRRVTASTPFTVTGPAAGHERLRTSADPSGTRVLGTLNNCAGGTTPWGTVLSGEENFNQYFGSTGGLDRRYAASYARYGITARSSREWWTVEPRFDLAREPHEPFRFGWIVEIDPTDPTSTPVKHTMLGRFKHEGANVILADDGRAVAYMGDDERGDYLYKFVSADAYVAGDKAHNLRLLTRGTLYVARLVDEAADPEHDGVGEWIPLCSDTESFVPGMSVAEVLIDTRLAADLVGPTRMDRPEDVEPNPVNRKVYAALTNNSQRGSRFPVDEPNPLGSSMVRSQLGAPLTPASGNRNGYVLELTEDGGDHTGTGFAWVLMLVCGDPEAPETYFAGYPKEQVSPISCPDNVAFDSVGNLWISTDGNALGSNDGLFRCPVEGPERGRVRQFLTVPVGAECCGALITDDDRTVWLAPQHPGEGSTFASPSSTWPQGDGFEFPRPGVAVAWRAR
jgi:hypothetical protein